MTLRPQDLHALRVLSAVLAEQRWSFVVVGARVPWILAAHGETSLRVTRDIDTVVTTHTWKNFEKVAADLKAAGFERRSVYEFVSPEGAELDLIPFGDGVVKNDQIEWPDGTVMSALGIEEAFSTSVERDLEPNLQVAVAIQPAFALLKIIAYTDRPNERSKDLQDLVDAFARYEEEGDRRFDLVDTVIDDRTLMFDEAGAYLLGVDVGHLCMPKSRGAVWRFLDGITDEYAAPISQILALEKRASSDERRLEVWRLFRVFRAGVDAASAAP